MQSHFTNSVTESKVDNLCWGKDIVKVFPNKWTWNICNNTYILYSIIVFILFFSVLEIYWIIFKPFLVCCRVNNIKYSSLWRIFNIVCLMWKWLSICVYSGLDVPWHLLTNSQDLPRDVFIYIIYMLSLAMVD